MPNIIENYLNYFYNHQNTYCDIATFLAPIIEVEADEEGIDIFATRGACRTNFSSFATPTSFSSNKTKALEIFNRILDWDKKSVEKWQEIQELEAGRLINALNSPYYDLDQENEVITCNLIELMNQPDHIEREYIKSLAPDYTWKYQRTKGTIYRNKILQGIEKINIKPFLKN